MFLERVKTPGLAHLSYVLGDGGDAAVIDPRRDWEIYRDLAHDKGCRVRYILETHRNEDLISGAPALAEATGAQVFHGPNAAGEVAYAQTAREGESLTLGDLKIEALETPGHTDDHLAFAVYDKAHGGAPFAVFTGDALFVGDVGRTDFYPERRREVAGLLYESLQKILTLGDGVLLYPAHGAGSVCGSGMAPRDLSTLGYERLHNPMLQCKDKAEFIKEKVREHHYQPPYFRLMERLNLEGAPGTDPRPAPLSPEILREEDPHGMWFIDVRGVEAFACAHVPGSLALPVPLITAYAGWLLEADERVCLIAEDEAQAREAALHLARVGLGDVVGFVATSAPALAAQGFDLRPLPVVGTHVVKARLEGEGGGWTLLDVRGIDEVEAGRLSGSTHIYLGELAQALGELDPTGRYTVMCGSGVRATVAASILERGGFLGVDVYLGSMKAWRNARGDDHLTREGDSRG